MELEGFVFAVVRLGWADCLEELFKDGIESADFPLGGVQVVG